MNFRYFLVVAGSRNFSIAASSTCGADEFEPQ